MSFPGSPQIGSGPAARVSTQCRGHCDQSARDRYRQLTPNCALTNADFVVIEGGLHGAPPGSAHARDEFHLAAIAQNFRKLAKICIARVPIPAA